MRFDVFLRFSGVHLSDTRFHFSVCPSLELPGYGRERSHPPSFALGDPIISASWSHLLGSCLIDCGASYRYTGSGCYQRTARLPRLVCLTALIERETAPPLSALREPVLHSSRLGSKHARVPEHRPDRTRQWKERVGPYLGPVSGEGCLEIGPRIHDSIARMVIQGDIKTGLIGTIE